MPFNIASYALLTHDGGAGQRPRSRASFVHTLGDAHLYLNHLEQARLQLDARRRGRCRGCGSTPTCRSLFDFRYEDFALGGYDPHPAIKAPVAV